jgi:hypothetical protein
VQWDPTLFAKLSSFTKFFCFEFFVFQVRTASPCGWPIGFRGGGMVVRNMFFVFPSSFVEGLWPELVLGVLRFEVLGRLVDDEFEAVD